MLLGKKTQIYFSFCLSVRTPACLSGHVYFMFLSVCCLNMRTNVSFRLPVCKWACMLVLSVCPHIRTPVSISYTASLFMCRSRARPPPLENHRLIGVYRNKHLDPPGRSWTPLENVGPPLDPCISIVFSVIKPLEPLL